LHQATESSWCCYRARKNKKYAVALASEASIVKIITFHNPEQQQQQQQQQHHSINSMLT
jgi:hypothetical protein